MNENNINLDNTLGKLLKISTELKNVTLMFYRFCICFVTSFSNKIQVWNFN